MSAGAINNLTLWVKEPERLAAFYCAALGMVRQDANGDIAVGYGGQGARLVFCQSQNAQPYALAPQDRYWKIAITLPDLDHAYAELMATGHAASAPRQFREIGYLSHLEDPEGHMIEFIQHTFDGTPKTAPGDADQPLGGGAQIGLITLRTSDIDTDMERCRDQLGMRYLSRQAVSDRGFDLYFFGFPDDQPPEEDVNAIPNRPWLWQRPYTVLEFQHLLDSDAIAPKPAEAPVVHMTTADGEPNTFR